MPNPAETVIWRTSSHSGQQGDCVEVAVRYTDGQDA